MENARPRPWGRGRVASRFRGLTQLGDEMPCNIMADEILTPGEGQIRALFCIGGNPVVAFPNQRKVARALADHLGWELSEFLVRGRSGPALAGLGRGRRARVSAGAYSVLGNARRPPLALLVDDVITTGATAGACVEALEEAGVPCLGALSFARTSLLPHRL